jgi:hypothetical protein
MRRVSIIGGVYTLFFEFHDVVDGQLNIGITGEFGRVGENNAESMCKAGRLNRPARLMSLAWRQGCAPRICFKRKLVSLISLDGIKEINADCGCPTVCCVPSHHERLECYFNITSD